MCAAIRAFFREGWYRRLFPDERIGAALQHMELNLASDAYLVASCEIIANTALYPRPAAG